MSMTRKTGMAFALLLAGCASDTRDPFLWLEDVSGSKALAWVEARNAETRGAYADAPGFRNLQERIRGLLDARDRIPGIRKAGDRFYNFWRDRAHPRGLWRRTTLEAYRKPEPAWETVLDLDALAREEKENWVWGGATFLEPDGRRCLLSFSRGGGDAEVTREYDVEAKAFVTDGFILPEAKGGLAWRDLDSVYAATDFGPGTLTASGYPRVVKLWKRGTPLAEAEVVLEGLPGDMSVSAHRNLQPGFERDWLVRRTSFWTAEHTLLRDGQRIRLGIPDDALPTDYRDRLFVELRSPWEAGGRRFPAGALLAIGFEEFLAGGRAFEVLYEPGERRSLAAFFPTPGHVLVNELDRVRNRLWILTRKDGGWERRPFEGAPEFCTIGAQPVDADRSEDCFLNVEGFLTPPSLLLASLDGGTPELLQREPARFRAEGLEVSQHEAVSRDGTRIPYFLISPRNLPLDGSRPALLTGYGGFEVPLMPHYDEIGGAAWLERGGTLAVANIRGGGEFGPAWHQAALKANRPRAYEDFAAVAEDLVRRGVTSAARLGIKGGSNGGLLVGNMVTGYPDRFGAAVCQVPLLDMRRYHTLLAGASWMAEYGNPDLPAEWAFIRTFSPYHNLEAGRRYPPVLFMTSTRDDRVHPGHARKMAARMLAMGQDVRYYENTEGGHRAAANHDQSAFMQALAYTFLGRTLGLEPGG